MPIAGSSIIYLHLKYMHAAKKKKYLDLDFFGIKTKYAIHCFLKYVSFAATEFSIINLYLFPKQKVTKIILFPGSNIQSDVLK